MPYEQRFKIAHPGVVGLALALSIGSATWVWAVPEKGHPVAVSPGSAAGALIADTCPTFSWGTVPSAESYELVVYRVDDDSEEARPVLRRSFPGSVSGWTPSLDSCLARGGRYAWNVRAVGQSKVSEWSPLSIFQVASGPNEKEFEEALQVVRQYLAGGGEAETASAADTEPSAGTVREASGDAPEPLVPPAATQLTVDGNVEAMSYTGDGESLDNVATDVELANHKALPNDHHTPTVDTFVTNKDAHDHEGGDGAAVLHSSLGSVGTSDHHARYTDSEAVAAVGPGSTSLGALALCDGVPGGWRWWDLGDGTVLDCNTRKIWLKDASCLGNVQWIDDGFGSVFTKVADLNSGTDFSCSGYTPGTYTDWEVPAISDLCSAGAVAGVCPAGKASDSLVDSSVSGSPKVANGPGDAVWTPGNVFIGVQQLSLYWSATEYDAGNAWLVPLEDGDVSAGFKDDPNYVWPVRSGQ